jgi:hypothetical protein
MNKKGDAFSSVQKAVIAILLIGIGVVIVLFILGIFKPFKNCPAEDCVSKCAEGTTDVGKDCKEEGMICCQSVEGFLGVKKKNEETPSLPVTSTLKSSKIHITFNDEFSELPSTSNKILEIGKVYTFHISAEGTGATNCKIQLLDDSGTKVADSTEFKITGTSDGVNCQNSYAVTLKPEAWSLNGEKYELQIGLFNEANSRIVSSVIYINLALSPEDLKVLS